MTNPITSVKRSAKTIGAVRVILIPLILFKRYDFNISPSFPGVTDIDKPLKNTIALSFLGTSMWSRDR